MAVKPTLDPKWSTNNNPADNIEPTSTLKNAGTPTAVPWGREHLNWQFFAISKWIDWVRSFAMDKDLNLSELVDKDASLTNLGGTVVGRGVFKAANTGTARTTLGMGVVGSDITTAITKKDAMRSILPVGFVYVQFPGLATPAALFGGTWELRFNTEGVFFRTEGELASAFESGIQADQNKEHTHLFRREESSSGSRNNGAQTWVSPNANDRSTSPSGGDEARPTNRTIRVWLKTGESD